MSFKFAIHQVSRYDASCLTIDQYDVEHFVPCMHFHVSQCNLPLQSAVCTKQQLLARLAGCVKSALNLCSTETSVTQQASVLPRKRNALRHTLVNDSIAYLCQAMHVRFPCPVITAFNSIIKKTENRV